MRKINARIAGGLILVGTCVLLFTAACRKRQALNTDDTGYATDHAATEQTFNDVQAIADQASVAPSGSFAYRGTGGGCATVEHSTGTIIIDFGPANCVCRDGRRRRGKIIVTYTGTYADSGSSHIITFDNFYQNDNKITGNKTVTNMGRNISGYPWFNVHIDGAMTMKGGGTITSVWDRVRTWTDGYDTPADMSDDDYTITGSGKMTRANGTAVNISITSPLIVMAGCRWIEQGSVTYTLPGGAARILDFGDQPVCNDTATVTLANGDVRTIVLP